MTEYYIIAIFILWYLLSMIISENMGNKKKIGVEWSFFISMVLSPVFGYLITRFSPEK